MRRSNLVSFFLPISIISIYIISIIIDNGYLFFSTVFTLLLSFFIVSYIEKKKLTTNLESCFSSNNYQGAIRYLNEKVKRCFSSKNARKCLMDLVMIYMLVDDSKNAKNILNNYKRIKKSKDLLLIRMILAIQEGNIFEAKKINREILVLKSNKYYSEQATSNQIIIMIETEQFNRDLYEKAKFPAIKSLCLKYKEEVLENQDGEKKTTNINYLLLSPSKSSGAVKAFAIILMILSPLSLFIAFLTVVGSSFQNYATSMEGLYYFISNSIYAWLFLPITLASIIYGACFYKKERMTLINIIIGAMFSFLLMMFGAIHLATFIFSTDLTYLNNISEETNVDFPQDASIITVNWTTGEQTSYDNNYYKYESVVRFYDDHEIELFEERIDSSIYWGNELSNEIQNFIPFLYVIETTNYDNYLLYCIETKTFNHLYDSSELNYIFMSYDSQNSVLLIYEFCKN